MKPGAVNTGLKPFQLAPSYLAVAVLVLQRLLNLDARNRHAGPDFASYPYLIYLLAQLDCLREMWLSVLLR